ncbi:DUF3352 domain-containing protein [Microcoleus sp. FACHB-1515]|uniref:DUF3352 domain-containing protein n=1 Tax=Cyanophyceae TaxID=3028117 RepID=UPI0016891119|nr:DUF3352 domain-containing protein [Microcoleus sp. FACHB-1515]MBD2088441.1 DUF3352 domain-containing protein [Microcoleus sp. FACHB-1515]
MLKKRAPVLIAAGTAIALAAGGGGAYWWMQQQVPVGELPAGVDVVPRNALATISLTTNEGQWRRLRQFGTAQTQATFDRALADWRDRLLTANNLNYSKDIRPWVGEEVTIAFLSSSNPNPTASPSSQAPIEGQQTPVILAPIANAARAQQIFSNRQSQAQTREYKGESIGSIQNDGKSYAYTVVDNRLIAISPDAKAIEQVIDTQQSGASIVKTPGFAQAVNRLETPQPFARTYLNVPAVNAVLATSASRPLPLQILTPLQRNQGMVATATIESEGVRFQGTSWLRANDDVRNRVTNSAERMPNILPADTLMMASGGNLRQLWQDYSDRVTAPSELSPDNFRRAISSTTGLDLDKDLMAWMNGEFAIGLVPFTQTGTAPSAGVMLLVQASDRRAADAALAKLDEAMKTRYQFQVSQADIGGKPVTNWTSQFSAIRVTRGWLDGNVAFLALNGTIAQSILPQTNAPLAADPAFQAATNSTLTPNNGHFFVNLDRLTQQDTPFLLFPLLPPQTRELAQAMQSIGVTGAVVDDRTTRYDVLVRLRKNEDIKPLPAPTNP